MKVLSIVTLICLLLSTLPLGAQENGRAQFRERLRQRFDIDGDGRLSSQERATMRKTIQQWREKQNEAAHPPTLRGLYGQSPPQTELFTEDVLLPKRGEVKELRFRITRPQAAGPYPVIVWSHGLFGSQDNYKPLVEHWARHGYLVLQPTHSDSLKYGETDFKGLDRGLAQYMTDWASRPSDVKRVLKEVERRKEWRDRADLSRLGVGGHSFGAHTTMLLSGARPTLAKDLSDPRPKAFLAISPQGEGRLFDSQSWNGLSGPIFFISGDQDKGQNGQPASWRREPYDGSLPGQKYLLWIKDAYHGFGGISGARGRLGGPANPDHVEIVKSASLMFWDAKLKTRRKAEADFEKGQLNQSFAGRAQWTKK